MPETGEGTIMKLPCGRITAPYGALMVHDRCGFTSLPH